MSDSHEAPTSEEKLRELAAALRSEFEISSSQEGALRKGAMTDLSDMKEDMLEALKHSIKYAQNESLRAKVAMWGYDHLLEQGKASSDPLADLLKHLPVSTPTTN